MHFVRRQIRKLSTSNFRNIRPLSKWRSSHASKWRVRGIVCVCACWVFSIRIDCFTKYNSFRTLSLSSALCVVLSWNICFITLRMKRMAILCWLVSWTQRLGSSSSSGMRIAESKLGSEVHTMQSFAIVCLGSFGMDNWSDLELGERGFGKEWLLFK